jgi:hypothetical protein
MPSPWVLYVDPNHAEHRITLMITVLACIHNVCAMHLHSSYVQQQRVCCKQEIMPPSQKSVSDMADPVLLN